jgi:acetate kinase
VKILVVNCGSSSVKFQLIETSPELAASGAERLLARGLIDRIGDAAGVPDHEHAIRQALAALTDPQQGAIGSLAEIDAVGHRMVHGGETFRESVIIDEAVLGAIEECVPLAPLHNPHNLAGYQACRRLLPRAPHVAVFDTAFHQTLPPKAYTYGLPHVLAERHRLRRYGFHGTSHRYLTLRFAELHHSTPEAFNLITCHLGNGCSMCAVERGRSVDCSLGFSTVEGLLMGTRTGDVDASAVLRLMAWEQFSLERMQDLLHKESGLYGISGVSNDVRTLLAEARAGHARARLALDVFCYRIQKYIGAFYAALGGAHAVIFSAGIGENAPDIRAAVCAPLHALGIRLDPARNAQATGREMDISAEDAPVRVWVIPTNEELLIARDTVRCLAAR